MQTVTVMIPCFNEEKGIGNVIDNIPIKKLKRYGLSVDILVVDNNSTDDTAKIAMSKGARVVFEKRQGKGYAIRTGFRNISPKADYVVMLDGDDTYKGQEMLRLLEPLESGFCDVVVGSRLSGKMNNGSMTFFNRLGNWMFTFLVRVFYAENVTDVCTGFFAWKRGVTDELVRHLNSEGFAVEMEMISKMSRLGYSIYSVPITYDNRVSDSKLRPFRDGMRIFSMGLRNLLWVRKKVTATQKIAIVEDAIFPYNKGGKETRWYELSTRLAKLGHEVHIYTMKWWDGPSHKIENGVHLHGICKNIPLYTKSGRRSIWQGLRFGLSCFKLLKEDFDIVDVDHMPFFPILSVGLVASLKRKPLIATWHEVWGQKYWNEYLGWKGFIGYLIERMSVRIPKRIISVSNHTNKLLRDELNTMKDIFTVPNGIDIKMITDVKKSILSSDVIFAGRLLKNKNIDVMLRAISLIKKKRPVRCFIIGEGPEKKKLMQLTKELGLEDSVKFFGFLKEHSEVYSLMKSSKVFVLPSTREGFGIVPIEANACGIPVITIDHESNASKDLIIQGDNGFLCSLDEREISKKILEVISNGKDNRIKQECLNSARQYDWKYLIDKVEAVYAG